MLNFLEELRRSLSLQERWQRFGIEVAMLVSALLETAGLGVFVLAVRFFLQAENSFLSWWMLLFVIFLLIAKNLFAYGIVVLQSQFVYRKQQTWCQTLFGRYLHGDFAAIRRRGGANCALSLSRVALLCDRALLPAMQLLADTLLAIVLIAALIIYLPWIALSGIFFFGAVTGLVWLIFHRKNRQLGEEAGQIDLAAGKLAAQSLDALETVRAFAGESFFARRYAAAQRQLAPLRKKLYDFGQAPRLILESSTLIYLLGLFGAMLLWKVPHTVILTDFAALIAWLSRFLPAFSRMHYGVTLVRQYQGIWSDFYRDLTALPQEAEFDEPMDFSVSGGIEVRDLAFGYTAEKLIFDHFALSVKPGECVGITGRTGDGKSTLFSLLLGFYTPLAGEIMVDGKPLREVLDSFRKQTGFVPQQIPLFEGSVRHNLTFGDDIPDEEIWRALKLAHIDDFVQQLPDKLEYPISPDGNNLSGGQRQRLAIARALCRKEVKLLLLDEATSALDAMTEAEIAETLSSLYGKMTILVISHREAALRSCDRIVAINA